MDIVSENEPRIQVLLKGAGSPPPHLDCSKSILDEAGLKHEKMVDYFGDSLSYRILGKLKVFIEFKRLSEHTLFSTFTSKNQLFLSKIKNIPLEYQKDSDIQLVTCLEALSKYPFFIKRLFTPKYDLKTYPFLS